MIGSLVHLAEGVFCLSAFSHAACSLLPFFGFTGIAWRVRLKSLLRNQQHLASLKLAFKLATKLVELQHTSTPNSKFKTLQLKVQASWSLGTF